MTTVRLLTVLGWAILVQMLFLEQPVRADTLYLMGFDSEDGRREISERIAPAKPFASPFWGFVLKGEVVSAQIDPATGDGFLTAKIWWRPTAGSARVYSRQPVRFSFDLSVANYYSSRGRQVI